MALISVKMDSYSSKLRASTLLRLSEKDAAMQKYSDAREALLYKREGIPEKIKRLQEVGAYLEYDLRRRKEERAKSPQVRYRSAKSEGREAGE